MAAFISLRSTSPPFCNTSLAKASPALAAKLSEMVFSIAIFLVPSRESRHPLNSMVLPSIFASAPMGAVHPPSRVLKKSRSICVHICDGVSFSF